MKNNKNKNPNLKSGFWDALELSVVSETIPVNNTEEVVEQSEDDELPVQQFIDAALPAQQQVEEGPQTGISDPARVRHRHDCGLLLGWLADCGVT